ncbi:LapA family protein [Aquincola sp. MAHUQ-54]|uniref:LapA family protein n=1 Tax=Aquincola agrisoli TaxID=3119538 RepID=A0AAW9QI15_9BURK
MSRTLLVLAVLALTAGFALLNWTAFATPTSLYLGFTTVEAPLGLIMLGLVALLSVVFVVWAISLQATLLMEQRRLNKELQAQRALADTAEASRFTELRSFIAAETLRIAQSTEQTRAALVQRMEQFEDRQRTAFEQSANAVAASLGELEDRLERGQALTSPALADRSRF